MPYINSINIKNIRSIASFQMNFEKGKEAGWHILIGDNGSGKTTVLRAIAAGLMGEVRSLYVLQPKPKDWIRKGEKEASIEVRSNKSEETVLGRSSFGYKISIKGKENLYAVNHIERDEDEYMSRASCPISIGAYRRFTGGEKDEEIEGTPAEYHRTLFGEKYALGGIVGWLQKLDYEEKTNSDFNFLKDIINFINHSQLLPNGAIIEKVSPSDVLFKNQEGNIVTLNELSDGYKSVIGLVLEIIRLLHKNDGEVRVDTENWTIQNPAIVLIDEIDEHLHPTWQTKIGEWFTQYFPNVQFIVTTHSPLICQSAYKGTIWQLPTIGNGMVRQITGDEYKRLVYGSVSDAFGTDVFGENVARSKYSDAFLVELTHLNMLAVLGKATNEQMQRIEELGTFLPSNSSTYDKIEK